MTDDRDGSRQVVLSGCSGGGKSTLLSELGRRGFAVVPEPGRRIVAEEMRGEGKALPWVDLAAFARRAIAIASDDIRRMGDAAGWVFFDRGLVDAAIALKNATGEAASAVLDRHRRYHRKVFLTPPWPELFATDAERRHGWADALAEYERLLAAYDEFGYETILLPKVAVGRRADFLLAELR